ncbi:putative lipoprotein with Yx(FWY)xxD motif [Pseudomonas sp. JUb42]|jgi:predicted lipoprotein with Yx(FWY)xxD motif|uniref:COG4315 family predicted lipoprotein n=1 Tax=Pseudomonas sp. JUb42 TaxID=2940611 RepID=UPI002168586A|nr:hypothetical protein [Pseudomonas sp. JUb42]MCS3468900.1 putative lipoprotein with Yx(FWY)xxD motif [Pseudomonas sp. JUb42]
MSTLKIICTSVLMTAGMTLSGLALSANPADFKDGILVDPQGMTLYSFDKDATNMSNCDGSCAVNWPPFIALPGQAATKWEAIKRHDGSMQWSYDGKPLYTWKDDHQRGDVTGDGRGGVWHIVKQ